MARHQYRILESSCLGGIPKKTPSIVIGAGINGLLTAYALKKAGVEVEVWEASDRVGGLIQSEETDYGLFETAANGIMNSVHLEKIAEELDLELIPSNKESKKRYIRLGQKLKKIPFGFRSIYTQPFRMLIPRKGPYNTMLDFGKSHFGSNFTRDLLNPGLKGIYGSGAGNLSFPGVLPNFAKALNSSKWLMKGLRSVRGKRQKTKIKGTVSFKGGMQELINALEGRLKDNIKLNHSADSLPKGKQIILTTPAYKTADFFNGILKKELEEIKYTSLTSVTTWFEHKQVEKLPNGFGILVTEETKIRTLGVLFNHDIFPGRARYDNIYSLTFILNPIGKDPNVSWTRVIVEEWQDLFGIKRWPVEVAVTNWEKALPIYSPGLYESWFRIDEELKKNYSNVRLFGNWTGKIAIRKTIEESRTWFD